MAFDSRGLMEWFYEAVLRSSDDLLNRKLLTADVGDPMLAQHLHSLMMFQRLAISNGYGWQRFLHMVDQVMPRRGDTLQLPLESMGEKEAAN